MALKPLNHKEAASDFAPRPPYPFNLLPSHRSNLAWERNNRYSASLPHLRDTRLWGLYPKRCGGGQLSASTACQSGKDRFRRRLFIFGGGSKRQQTLSRKRTSQRRLFVSFFTESPYGSNHPPRSAWGESSKYPSSRRQGGGAWGTPEETFCHPDTCTQTKNPADLERLFDADRISRIAWVFD